MAGIQLKCPYCGAIKKIDWDEGALPKCPNCGGEYDISREELQKMFTEAAESLLQTESETSGERQ